MLRNKPFAWRATTVRLVGSEHPRDPTPSRTMELKVQYRTGLTWFPGCSVVRIATKHPSNEGTD